jgi:hypothetical protein
MRNVTDSFSFDLFLSPSSKDKAVVRSLAERVRHDGLEVWFDEWALKPGDTVPARIEEGPEHTHVPACVAAAAGRRRVLCMSAQAFGSDFSLSSPCRQTGGMVAPVSPQRRA